MHQKLIFTVILTALSAVCDASDKSSREQAAQIVAQIQRADYEGDRATLKKCYNELTPFLKNEEVASRVRYWRGFDLWRRALNGFNDSVDPKELEQDLRQAVDEFKAAMQKDHAFVDAKIGMISCLGYLAFMKRTDTAAMQDLMAQIWPLVEEAKAAAPDNPRFHWVLGPILRYQAHESGSGPQKLIENYQTGLEHCTNGKQDKTSLEPSWGKPELLMVLAYTYLNGNPPNLVAAESNARAALEIVPYWHYTRDILLPQILATKAKTSHHAAITTNRSAPGATIVPILIYEDAGQAIDWLCRVFGFTERLRVEHDGVVVHAQLKFGDGAIIIGRQGGPFRAPHSNEVDAYVDVTVSDVDDHFQHSNQNGARIVQPPTDMPFGERQYTAEDLAGHRWMFSQHIADVAPEEWGGKTPSK